MAGAGVITGVVFWAALEKVGTAGLLLPLAALVVLILLRSPEACLGLLIGLTALAEAEAVGAIPSGGRFYEKVVSSLTGPDVLLLLGLAGVVLRFVARDVRPRLPDPFTVPLVILSFALVAGVATAITAPASPTAGELFHRSAQVAHLILVPVLTVNVLRSRRSLKVFAVAIAGLASLKALTGIYASFGGGGNKVESGSASFLNPLPNLMMLTLALGAIAALVRRVRVPPWMIATLPVALAALLLSYRRSFWIAGMLTIVLVVIIASRRRGRAVLAVGVVSIALGFAAVETIGASSDSASTSPIAERAQTLAPGDIGTNRGDRYRNDERANVIQTVERHPVTGVGLGNDWEIHGPLAEAPDRRYAHVAVLWYWVAFGILGPIAYVSIFLAGLWAARRIWRRHPDPQVQVCAIAAFGGLLALIVVELTATFAGIEPRLTILLGALLGWLAAAWLDLTGPALPGR